MLAPPPLAPMTFSPSLSTYKYTETALSFKCQGHLFALPTGRSLEGLGVVAAVPAWPGQVLRSALRFASPVGLAAPPDMCMHTPHSSSERPNAHSTITLTHLVAMGCPMHSHTPPVQLPAQCCTCVRQLCWPRAGAEPNPRYRSSMRTATTKHTMLSAVLKCLVVTMAALGIPAVARTLHMRGSAPGGNSGGSSSTHRDHEFDTRGMPSDLQQALQQVLSPQPTTDAHGHIHCRGHIVLTRHPTVGGNDRLRGAAWAAYAASISGRQLHIHPDILGPIQPHAAAHTPQAYEDGLLQQYALERQRTDCAPWDSELLQVSVSYKSDAYCHNASALTRVLTSRAAVVMFYTNCFFLDDEVVLPASFVPSPDRQAAGTVILSQCTRMHAVAQFNTLFIADMYTQSTSVPVQVYSRSFDKLPLRSAGVPHIRAAQKQCASLSPNETAKLYQKPTLHCIGVNKPPAGAVHCAQFHSLNRCGAYLLHAAWAHHLPQLYSSTVRALVHQHKRMHVVRQHNVVHVRSASALIESYGQHCTVSTLPWEDEAPPMWLQQTTLSAWFTAKASYTALRSNSSVMPSIMLSDSWRLQADLHPPQPHTLTPKCCSSPTHVGRLRSGQSHLARAAALQVLWDWTTIATARTLVHGCGLFWTVGVHWLSWEQGPMLASALCADEVPGAIATLGIG